MVPLAIFVSGRSGHGHCILGPSPAPTLQIPGPLVPISKSEFQTKTNSMRVYIGIYCICIYVHVCMDLYIMDLYGFVYIGM